MTIEVYNITDGAQLCEVLWNGAATDNYEGAWTAIDHNGDHLLAIRGKASSATEDLAITVIILELR